MRIICKIYVIFNALKLILLNKGVDMNKEKDYIEKIKEITDEFWNLDCLIRIAKELILNDKYEKQELQEEDIYAVFNILSTTSKSLADKITWLKNI